ncbi:MAG: ATP-dependent DNA helicase [Clostridiales bacterium]|nr:ATP-dependent DNA helicase [Clostridiales bacterium]
MKSSDQNNMPTRQNIAARLLVEQVYRSGDLSGVSFSSVSGREGTRLHRKVFDDIQKRNADKSVEIEVPLSAIYSSSDFFLEVSGRADCLLIERTGSSNRLSLIEIKAHNRQNAKFSDLFRPVHRAQLMVYAHMLMSENPDAEGVEIILSYVSVQTVQSLDQSEWVSQKDAAVFFARTCKLFKSIALQSIRDKKRRDESIDRLTFPYDGLRDGQKALMEQVVGSIRCKQILFAEAPTGIGKTIGVLFPSLKCLARGFAEKIFYLTAKISTRDVARKTLNDLRENGLFARSIQLASKESMCPNRDLYCEPRVCPCAIGYYDRLKDAVKDLSAVQDISPEVIKEVAKSHTLCPFELSLDVSIFCDIIIADYNHAFHPRIRLIRFFEDPSQSHILLNDEAHNLVDRSRDMFSARLSYQTFQSFVSVSRGMTPEIDSRSDSIQRYFFAAYEDIQKGHKAFDRIENNYSGEHIYQSDFFRAVRLIPKTLYSDLWHLCYRISFILDSLPVGPVRKAILDFFFEARFFLTITEQYFDESYIFSCKIEKQSNDLKRISPEMFFDLSCLDASGFIASQIRDRHPCVFFSATLSPSSYYRAMIVGPDQAEVEEMTIDSPFPPENLEISFHTEIRTVFRERHSTIDSVVECIWHHISKARGNYIAYFPSFKYMNSGASRFREKYHTEGLPDIIMQTRDMAANEKSDYLSRFDQYGKNTLLGFAVLGGHFGEGVDLVGDRLSGVFIVGVGIPQISPEREILRQYYQEKFGDGYSFAYRFPGWEKVLQACGRVIRDESDRGFVVVMDHRYALPEYRSLYPKHWQTDFAIQTDDYPDFTPSN